MATLAEAQRAVVAALGAEYYCDDLEPPPDAFGWGEQQLRDYFETGGMDVPAVRSAGSGDESRPVIVCLGDSLTEFGSHVVGPKFADATLKNTPTASDVLRATDGADEHGPGWVSLLARDYQWRVTADLVNRGHSGMNSRLLREDLVSIVSSLPVGAHTVVSAAAPQPPHVRHTARAKAGVVPPLPVATGCFWRGRGGSGDHAGGKRRVRRTGGRCCSGSSPCGECVFTYSCGAAT